MEFVKLGKTDEKLPALGMGTWKLGADRKAGISILREGIRQGMAFVDTAEMYGNEEIVGEALQGEEKVFVATKVSPQHFRHEEVIKACEGSLRKLRVKQIDLYQLHWPNKNVAIQETMGAMEHLLDEGKIRHIGVSNFSLMDLKEAQSAMRRYEIVSNQVEYSVLSRMPEEALSQYCRAQGITLIAYSPLGQGSLYSEENEGFLSVLAEIGARYGKSASQVALNWLISKGNVSAIPKTENPEHLMENLGAIGWTLSSADTERLDLLR